MCASAEGKLIFVRGSSTAKPFLSLRSLCDMVASCSVVAANDARDIVAPSLPRRVTLPAQQGIIHRVSRSQEYAQYLAKQFNATKVSVVPPSTLAIEGTTSDVGASIDFGKNWDTIGVCDAEVTNVMPYGLFVQALDGDKPLEGMTGLVHFSRCGVNGSSVDAAELKNLFKLKSKVKVVIKGWSEQGPLLSRV